MDVYVCPVFGECHLINEFATGVTRREKLVAQELPTLPEHLVHLGFTWDSHCWSSGFLCSVLQIIVLSSFLFGHCFVCPSSIYGFWFFLFEIFRPSLCFLYVKENWLYPLMNNSDRSGRLWQLQRQNCMALNESLLFTATIKSSVQRTIPALPIMDIFSQWILLLLLWI
jgi:hypothetical protein